MRGKGLFMSYEERIEGITPAYAGKRQATERCSIAGQDHPRLCGEKLKDRLVTAASKGSPPPMRGKACCVMPAFSRSRITPAYAGKSAQIEQAKFVLQDHPRLCGEKKSFRGKLQSRIGSPPPMRGKVKATPPHRNEPRITPAYAGKRPVWIAASRHGWDHPRLCGEKSSLSFVKMILSGSPPPMRGKGVRLTASGVYGRITPAYAGKSKPRYRLDRS